MTAAERLALWTRSLAFEEIPPEVLEHAKLHLLDAIGCGLAASALGVATEGRTAMAELGGEPQASVLGLEETLPAPNAAFANAMLCHGLDFDDTHSESVAHVSVVVCPAALAAAESVGASGRELLAAIVGGNEVVTRIGMAASGRFHERGFHPTAICGIFGATTAAARLAGIDATSALGIAGSFAGGLFAYLEDGTPTKPLHAGWAAHGGVLATRLAGLGSQGPPHVLEGRFGLYHAFVGEQLEPELGDLGERWETLRIAYKPYPACHYMHGSLGAVASLVPLDPDEIEEIVVAVPEAAVALVLEPAAAKVAPRSDYEAKFSLQYSAAAMLVHGRVGIASYTCEAIADSRVLELARKVCYETRNYPSVFGGGARIRLKDGRALEAELPFPRGAPENPMEPAEVRAKFRDSGGPADLEDAILSLEELDNVRGFLRQPVAA